MHHSRWTDHPIHIYVGIAFVLVVMIMMIVDQHSTIERQAAELRDRPTRIEYIFTNFECEIDESEMIDEVVY